MKRTIGTPGLGERLRLVRKKNGLTQAEFAARLGVGRDAVASYEVGRVAPDGAFIRLACYEFGVERSWLETGEEGKHGGIPGRKTGNGAGHALLFR